MTIRTRQKGKAFIKLIKNGNQPGKCLFAGVEYLRTIAKNLRLRMSLKSTSNAVNEQIKGLSYSKTEPNKRSCGGGSVDNWLAMQA